MSRTFHNIILSSLIASTASIFLSMGAHAQTVVIAIDPGSAESNLYWETIGGLIPPNLQTLVGNDPVTGEYNNSGLAESWEHNEDFTSWTFRLKPDAIFNDGWGPVTAADIVHSVGLHVGETSRLSGIQGLRNATVTEVDNHTIRFDLPAPDPDFLFLHAGRAILTIYSKAQFDAEGLDGYNNAPAGSGHFTLVSRDLNNTLKFNAIPDHWSGTAVNYDELELRFVAEPATRLAMLLAGEADIVSLPRELQPDAEGAGHQIITSARAAQQSAMVFGGLFMDPAGHAARENFPWVDIRVREAMNRAIDRQAVIDVLYQGRAETLPVWSMDPRFDGYVPDLSNRFEEAYGYDPEKARELLAEAGYPERFANPVIPIAATALAGSPEFGVMAELIEAFLAQIGLETEIREMDWPSIQNARLGFTAGFVHPQRNAPVRPNAIGVQAGYTGHLSPAYSLGSAELDALGATLLSEKDVDRREAIIGEMFTYIFDNYVNIPLATVFAEVAVNPATIAGWSFPGASSTGISHFELIQAAK